MPIDKFSRVKPKGLVTATVDAFTGLKPSGSTRRTVDELFIAGTEPTKAASGAVVVDIDAASGLRWRDGCVGPDGDPPYLDYSQIEGGFPLAGARPTGRGWPGPPRRPASGAGPKGTRTAYFYGGGFYPFGADVGRQRPPAVQGVPVRAAADAHRRASPTSSRSARRPTVPRGPGRRQRERERRTRRWRRREAEARRRLEPDDRGAVAAFAPLPGPEALDERVAAQLLPHGVAQRARPEPVDDQDLLQPCQ